MIDDEIRELIEDMYVTQDAAHGVGLAAPQIGVGLQIFVYEIGEDSGVFINPRIELGDEMQEGGEGCLSVPGYSFPLKRAEWVRIAGFDPHGQPIAWEATGWFARVMQHEYDHLDGKLYVDRLDEKWSRKARKALKGEGWREAGNTWTPGWPTSN